MALYALRSNEKLIARTTEVKLEKFINVQNVQRGKQRLVEWKEKVFMVSS